MRLAVPRVLGKACSKKMVIGKRAPRRRSKKSALSCSASASASQQVWEYKEQGGQFGGTNRPYAGAWGEVRRVGPRGVFCGLGWRLSLKGSLNLTRWFVCLSRML